jgi:very-short-patch-repair endonuclease
MADVDLRQELLRLGGVADRATLVALTSRAEVDRALRAGEVVRAARGRYALPIADQAVRIAASLSGVVSHRSAALHWGWELKTVPSTPEVTVRRKRRLTPEQRAAAAVHWADLEPEDVTGRVTSPRRTLVDCLRTLPFDEALAVADSALRHRSLGAATLVELTAGLRGAGAARCRRVAREASPDAANPFESVLRAIAADVAGLDVVPQVTIRAPGFSVQPDLVDVARRVVLEADSFTWHGDRSALRWDSRRYNNLVVRGWLVLRFSWEDVMHDQDYVRRTLRAIGHLAHRQAEVRAGLAIDA